MRLYLDNAATSFPKPPQVLEAMRDYAEQLGGSAGRGAYREAIETAELVADCRRTWARLINAPAAKHIVFALNCSEALNLAIKGILRPGDHAVATKMDHNSILRPLNGLALRGDVSVTFVEADPMTGLVPAENVLNALRPNTRLVAMQHASNVTGALQPIEQIAPALRKRSVLFLVDAAQTAGHVPIDVQADGIDFLAMPGHKGWLGPLGTGGLYVRPGLEDLLVPLIEGGTGSVSENPIQPDFLPDKFESGSHNAIGIAGLGAALNWIERKSISTLHEHDLAMSRRFLDAVAEVPGLTVYGPRKAEDRVAVFSVRLAGFEPAELSALLESEFEILSRSGLHCAPLAHETIGTAGLGGTTRLSFGPFNTHEDVDRCAQALAQLADANVKA